ncbi:hypothetical protein BaRGS_00018968, partial [Batillaria attramentaria]
TAHKLGKALSTVLLGDHPTTATYTHFDTFHKANAHASPTKHGVVSAISNPITSVQPDFINLTLTTKSTGNISRRGKRIKSKHEEVQITAADSPKNRLTSTHSQNPTKNNAWKRRKFYPRALKKRKKPIRDRPTKVKRKHSAKRPKGKKISKRKKANAISQYLRKELSKLNHKIQSIEVKDVNVSDDYQKSLSEQMQLLDSILQETNATTHSLDDIVDKTIKAKEKYEDDGESKSNKQVQNVQKESETREKSERKAKSAKHKKHKKKHKKHKKKHKKYKQPGEPTTRRLDVKNVTSPTPVTRDWMTQPPYNSTQNSTDVTLGSDLKRGVKKLELVLYISVGITLIAFIFFLVICTVTQCVSDRRERRRVLARLRKDPAGVKLDTEKPFLIKLSHLRRS